MPHRYERAMYALLLFWLLVGTALAPTITRAATQDGVRGEAPASGQAPRLLAQRQPGGLPGRSDIEEEGRPGGKPLPGDRAQQPAAPATRSLQNAKPRGPSEAGPEAGAADKKAAPGAKKTPDKGN